ncbi:hypothetical protein MP228_006759 [Amoeboaphelidium protococcarum]|nr:hypothetical protein MP228_006759 [Amoeboaphelidium protococcarum]
MDKKDVSKGTMILGKKRNVNNIKPGNRQSISSLSSLDIRAADSLQSQQASANLQQQQQQQQSSSAKVISRSQERNSPSVQSFRSDGQLSAQLSDVSLDDKYQSHIENTYDQDQQTQQVYSTSGALSIKMPPSTNQAFIQDFDMEEIPVSTPMNSPPSLSDVKYQTSSSTSQADIHRGKGSRHKVSERKFVSSPSLQDFVSKTRQRNLPPKSKSEDDKHLREYKRLQKLQQRRKLSSLRSEKRFQKRLEQASKWWLQTGIPNFKQLQSSRRMHKVWDLTLPSDVRKQVWILHCCGGEYKTAMHIRQMNEIIQSSEFLDQVRQQCLRVNDSITVDEEVIHVIASMTRQSESFIVQRNHLQLVKLVQMVTADPVETVRILSHLLRQPLFQAVYHGEDQQLQSSKQAHIKVFGLFVAQYAPELYTHLVKFDVGFEFIIDLLQSVCSNVLPIDPCLRIMDLYLLHGDIHLLRVCLANLTLIQHELIATKSQSEIRSKIVETRRQFDFLTLHCLVNEFKECNMTQEKYLKWLALEMSKLQ